MISYFIPSLSAILINAEDKKGTPLEYNEVISIRDKAVCIMMDEEQANKMDEKRGYIDVHPENIWYDWQMLRKEMGRKPDIDPGPSFAQIDSKNNDYQKTIIQAINSLSSFRAMLPQDGSPKYDAMLKIQLSHGDESAFIWLANTRLHNENFLCQIFEVPKFLTNVEVGQVFEISENELVDWMVNEDGVLYGGFSLRLHRSTLPKEEQIEFDEYIGVVKYA